VEMTGVCKISDFGISKRTDDSSGGAFTAMQGTVFWMAPEVINTQKKGYNFKIDIWSVGCVVLEMWAGMRPWMGDEAVAVMFKVLLISVQIWKRLTLTHYASFTSLSSLLQYQKTSSCPNWRMISGESVLPCELIRPFPNR
jgi:serine/threonine protein kinase